MMQLEPSVSKATTGSPHDIASGITSPKGSSRDVSKNMELSQ